MYDYSSMFKRLSGNYKKNKVLNLSKVKNKKKFVPNCAAQKKKKKFIRMVEEC